MFQVDPKLRFHLFEFLWVWEVVPNSLFYCVLPFQVFVAFLFIWILVVTHPCWVSFLLLHSSTVAFQFFECPLNVLQTSVTRVSIVLQMTISQLKAELEKGPQEAAVYTQQIHQLQSDLNNLQQQSQVPHTPSTIIIIVMWLEADYCRQIMSAEVSATHCVAYDCVQFTSLMWIRLASCPSSTEHTISVSVNLPLLPGTRLHHNALLSPALFDTKTTCSSINKPAGGDLCHAMSLVPARDQSSHIRPAHDVSAK